MINYLLEFSVRNRLVVLLFSLMILVAGIWNARLLPIDAVPDITNKQVQVNVQAPALGPEEIERQITFPLELAFAGLPNLEGIRSISQFGLCQVTVVFKDEVDIYFARQLINERIGDARQQLPAGAKLDLSPVSTGLGEILYLKLDNPKLSLMERRNLVDWTVRPQLLAAGGLAEVNTWGGEVKQLQVLIDPRKLQSFGFSIKDLIAALASNNSNGGGASIRSGSEQQIVRSIGQYKGPEDVSKVVIGQHGGTPVLVSQVAEIKMGPMVRQGAMTENGKGEEVFAISMLLLGENGAMAVERVKARAKLVEKALPEGSKLVPFLDRSELINRTLKTGATNLLEGGALVIGLLFLFLLQWRAGLIVSCAIPLSMLMAMMAMRYFNISANLMSLGAIDFGLIVDGAVIIVENCVRRLSERHQELGRDLTEPERLHEILEGSKEVRQATQFGELIIIATYLPILTLQDIEGKMFRPMGLTVIFALLGAMLLSFTLIPSLCSLFLKLRQETHNPVMALLTRLYKQVLAATLDKTKTLLVIAAIMVAISGAVYSRLGSEFIPELDEGALAVQAAFLPSISLDEVVSKTSQTEKFLLENYPNEIKKVISRIGRAEIATDPMLISQVDMLLELQDESQWTEAHSRAELVEKMSHRMEEIPYANFSFSQPIKMRMMELIEGTGIRADLGIKMFGSDPKVLLEQANLIADTLRSVKGAADVQVETTQGLPQLEIVIDRDKIARYGINVADVNLVVEAALGGMPITRINDANQRYDVCARFPDSLRNNPEEIRKLLIESPSGRQVPLSELADFNSIQGPVQISRENGQRRIVIQSNVRGRDLGGFVEDAQRQIEAKVKLPSGYILEFGGTYEKLVTGRRRLAVVVPVTFSLVFLLLYLTFDNLRQAVIVFTGIPFAVTGGVLALWLRGMPVSISASIGFIALAGVAVLNGLVMVSHIRQALAAASDDFKGVVISGACDRLRPVLMTASVACFGFLPMAFSSGAGAEVQRPLATVVIGGLLTSTLLTLLILPSLLLSSAKRKTNPEV